MLSIAFFFSVFISVVWAFYALSNATGGDVNHFVVTAAVVFLPIIIVWLVFGYIYQYISTSVLNKNMYSLFKQMKKNQETAEVIARALIEAKEESKNNTVISKFDIFISDMNELLSDIIKRSELVSDEQIDALWVKVKNGGKWAFGKVIIELAQKQPNLPNKLLQKALAEPVLGGTILEFCSRYQSLINALEKHDNERLFLNMVETGVLGKVFTLLAHPADSIRQNRDLTLVRRQINETDYAEMAVEDEFLAPAAENHTEKTKPQEKISENARRLFINTFRKKENQEPEAKDPLTEAFAKSFGVIEKNEEETDRQIPSLSSENILGEEETSDGQIFDEADEKENQKDLEKEDKQQEETVSSMPEIIISREEPLFEQNYEEDTEPHFEKEEPRSKITPELTAGFQNTQEKLEDIRKEWEEAKQRDALSTKESTHTEEAEGMPEPQINKDSDFSYPFGGWMNTDNYEK